MSPTFAPPPDVWPSAPPPPVHAPSGASVPVAAQASNAQSSRPIRKLRHRKAASSSLAPEPIASTSAPATNSSNGQVASPNAKRSSEGNRGRGSGSHAPPSRAPKVPNLPPVPAHLAQQIRAISTTSSAKHSASSPIGRSELPKTPENPRQDTQTQSRPAPFTPEDRFAHLEFPEAADNEGKGKRRTPRQARRGRFKAQQDGGKDSYDVAPSSEDESGPLLARVALPNGHEADLSQEILRLYEDQKASPQAIRNRLLLIDILNRAINGTSFHWGHHHSSTTHPLRVEAFGSARFGLSTSSSDIDLCIFDPYRPNGFDHQVPLDQRTGRPDLPQIYDMRRLARVFHQIGFEEVLPVPFAGVPIVKFQATINGERINADINTNERFGVLNSRLINAYCNLSDVVRPLCVFIKFWARQRQLNDPSGSKGPASFSSYTLILLVIAYLQVRGVLPNLQDPELIQLSGIERKRFWSRPKGRKAKNKIGRLVASTGWDVTFLEDFEGWQGGGDLRDLAMGFFEYYSERLDFDKQVVSINRGEPFPRENDFAPNRSDARLLEAYFAREKARDAERGEKDGDRGLELGPDVPSANNQEELEDPLRSETDHDQAEAIDERSEAPHDDSTLEAELTHMGLEDHISLNMSDLSTSLDDDAPIPLLSLPPVRFDRFVEPSSWTQKMIVQDPFLLQRNTATNIAPDVIETFLKELRRAKVLIGDNAPIDIICASKKNEPEYKSLASERRTARRARLRNAQREKEMIARAR